MYFVFLARTVQTKFDAMTLHSNPQVARDTGMVDDGSGAKVVSTPHFSIPLIHGTRVFIIYTVSISVLLSLLFSVVVSKSCTKYDRGDNYHQPPLVKPDIVLIKNRKQN